MSCIQPMLVRNKSGLLVRVPCGRCYGCLRRKQRELALRLSYDIKNSYDCLFVTLTYDDEHLITNYIDKETGAFYPLPSVSKDDAQRFLKRLRKNLHYDSSKTYLSYYLSAEYGDESKRPHMHIILYLIGKPTNIIPLSTAVEKSWNKCNWDLVNREQCIKPLDGQGALMYVAKHQMKKCQGSYLQAPYFQLRSKGIGKTFLNNDIETQFAINNGFLVYDRNKKAPIPRYFAEKLGIEKTDGEVRRGHLEEIEKESQQFDRAWKYYKQTHPKVSFETFVKKYFGKLVKDHTYSEQYHELMYKKLRESKI